MPESWQSRTPHGSHDYFRHPGFNVRNKVKFANWPLPFDFRGDGGYVVTPGSDCFGSVYRWVDGHSPSDLPLADAPAWLLTELQKRAEQPQARSSLPPEPYRGSILPWARKAFDAEVSLLSSAIEGSRNMTLLGVGRRLGELVGGGELEESEVRTALRTIAETWVNEDLPHSLDTLERALAFGKRYPRSAPFPKSNSVQLMGDEPPGSQNVDESFWSEQPGCEDIDPSFWA